MRLKDKVIIVTGSTTDIGESIARRALAEGAFAIIYGRDALRGRELVDEYGEQAVLVVADLADPATNARCKRSSKIIWSFGCNRK